MRTALLSALVGSTALAQDRAPMRLAHDTEKQVRPVVTIADGQQPDVSP